MEPLTRTRVSHPAQKGLRATLLSIVANLGMVAIKALAGYFGNSYALIADAIESASDVFTSFIVWIGLRAASKEPDQDHPYGHGKAEPLATIVVALSLIAAAIFISIQSVEHIITPHRAPAPFTLILLIIIILVKESLYRYSNRVGSEIESAAVKADAWHHRSDAITSLTAAIGIAIALIGGPGYESADDWAALIASVIIVINAYRIFMPAFTEIMDAAPPSAFADEIRLIAATVPGVQGLDKCLVRKMGFEYFVDLHVIVNASLTVKEGHDIAHAVKAEIMRGKPSVYDVLVHIEPTED
ncbi:MAG: Cobalt-zinc-cadmium resistance protein [uncultured Adhaeribacter sp.]|uniref:Cobalt-zinc-cadmium resistance protein n=1 Tax=uncultured Adhaeribacter sp. TaxID=448109 RepID=A0A6J4IIT8_9BACT|nr:MAG: Cobalt-zinc-cadmium resistance protein [uncultured Adhaeribacter sp.]